MMDFKEEWKRSPEYQPLAHEISDEIWSPRNCNSNTDVKWENLAFSSQDTLWHLPLLNKFENARSALERMFMFSLVLLLHISNIRWILIPWISLFNLKDIVLFRYGKWNQVQNLKTFFEHLLIILVYKRDKNLFSHR